MTPSISGQLDFIRMRVNTAGPWIRQRLSTQAAYRPQLVTLPHSKTCNIMWQVSGSIARRRCILWRSANRRVSLSRSRARCRHVRGWTRCNSPILRRGWILRWGLRPIGRGWHPVVRRECITCGASKTWAQAEEDRTLIPCKFGLTGYGDPCFWGHLPTEGTGLALSRQQVQVWVFPNINAMLYTVQMSQDHERMARQTEQNAHVYIVFTLM